MKRMSRTVVTILALLLVVQPVFSWAGPGARVIPQGNVSLLEEGKEVGQFRSELPLPEGTLMLCNGNCLVQTQNLQLVARDQAVFALAETKERWDLTVKSGQLDFAMRPEAKPISFHTPHDTLQTQGAIVPASGTAMVRGSIKVTENESVLTMQEGTLQVMSPDGTVLVQPGQGLRLAQAQGTPKAATASAGAGGGTSTLAWVGAAVGVAAIGTVAGVVGTSGGGTTTVSGF
jgi:hypothetical protein